MHQFKALLSAFTVLLLLAGCSTNPATGQQQFTALLSPADEIRVGAQEHEKIAKQFGLVEDKALNAYVTDVGRRVTRDTERPDVEYKFYILDTPIVNAFAVPGGYIYVSRGLLALANNEAELASVLGHEAGHITGRHSAERYSKGVVTSLGAGLLGAVIGSSEASQALNLGSNLYLSSYSRSQENEADTLGLRYMTRAGYDPDAVPAFLASLQRHSALEARLDGRSNKGPNYFSTHPETGDRVAKTRGEAAQVSKQDGTLNRTRHLKAISGMVYGDSAKQGFMKGQTFFHPELGFKFNVPQGFRVKNQPTQIAAISQSGAVIVFDMASYTSGRGIKNYLLNGWLKEPPKGQVEEIEVNGRAAVTVSYPGRINGKAMTIRLVAIEFGDKVARFQMGIPQNVSGEIVEGLKKTTYSFDSLSKREKASVRPKRVQVKAAKTGDTVDSFARQMAFDDEPEERFRILNGLGDTKVLRSGQLYKLVQQ